MPNRQQIVPVTRRGFLAAGAKGCAALGLLGTSGISVALAQPPQEKGGKNPHPNVPKEVIEQFKQAADREAKQAGERQLAQSKAAVEQIEKALANERASVEGQLKKQPDYVAYRKVLDELLARKPNTEEETQKQSKALAQLHQQYQKMYVTAYRAAQIDEQRVQDVLSRACQAKVIPIQGAPGTYQIQIQEEETPKGPSQKGQSAVPPYPDYSGSQNTYKWGISSVSSTATPSTGRCYMDGSAWIAGGGWNDASVGNFFFFPSPHSVESKVTVKVNAKYDLEALAVLGVSIAHADLIVQSIAQHERKKLASVIAPLFWWASSSGNKFIEFTKNLNISSLPVCGIQAGGETGFTAIGPGAVVYATNDVTVREIVVSLVS